MPKKKPRKQSRARAREEDDSIGGMISNATRELKKIWSNPLYRVVGVMILSQILSNRLEDKSDDKWRDFIEAPTPSDGGFYVKDPKGGGIRKISPDEAAREVASGAHWGGPQI